jgi:hypothetical protein
MGTFLLLIGSVFFVVGVQEFQKEQTFRSQGLTAHAIVVEKSLVKAKRGENRATRYVITYRFTTQAGEERDGSADVPVEEWERVERGQTIPVTYVPGVPDANRAQGNNEWIAALVFLCLGGVFVLLGGGLAFSDARALVRATRLSRHGLVTDGTVLRAEPTGTMINRVTQWRIVYRYRDHVGRSHEASSYLMPPEEAASWKDGDTGTVRFDRERPEISLWAGRT